MEDIYTIDIWAPVIAAANAAVDELSEEDVDRVWSALEGKLED